MPTPNTNPEVLTTFDPPDPNMAPLNLTQLFQIASALVHSEILGSYLPYVIKNGDPDVNDQDKAWIELDTQGRPVATKVFWHGSWRRIYNGMLGEIRGFHGAPGYSTLPGNNFNENGMGNKGGEYDGWHLCNGKDGTPDMSDKFLLGGHMNKSDSKTDYDDGEWISWIDKDKSQHTGGVTDFTLNEKTTYRLPIDPLISGNWSATGNARSTTGQMYGDPHKIPGTNDPDPKNPENSIVIVGDDGNITPDKVSVVNPFIVIGWIIFVGYQS